METQRQPGIKKSAQQILLKEIMKYPPIVVREDDKFHMVERILRESKIKHLPVVDNDGILVGVITLSDLYRTASPKKNVEEGTYFYEKDMLDKYILKHVMTRDPQTLKADNTLMEAMNMMVDGGFGCTLVVDEDHMIKGIVTQTDVIRVVTAMLRQD
jgi:acetoin utilization protein AcuB